MNKMSASENTDEVSEFRHKLKANGQAFILESAVPGDKVYLKFEGALDGVIVIWHACVQTIEKYSLNNPVDEDPKQFIKVGIVDGLHKLDVALNIKQIDLPALERTIIMIRRYKRLTLGYHEYGARSKTE
ncbi:MAG: hypothetical protein OQK46_05930 [Gammaproteobacteria bacterium]|nr:hypothetical protein [Gammaproteobacteria bacterium]